MLDHCGATLILIVWLLFLTKLDLVAAYVMGRHFDAHVDRVGEQDIGRKDVELLFVAANVVTLRADDVLLEGWRDRALFCYFLII